MKMAYKQKGKKKKKYFDISGGYYLGKEEEKIGFNIQLN